LRKDTLVTSSAGVDQKAAVRSANRRARKKKLPPMTNLIAGAEGKTIRRSISVGQEHSACCSIRIALACVLLQYHAIIIKTEEQWEASACLKKRKNQYDGKTHFRLCVACIKRTDDPSAVEPCWGAPHPPCPSIKEGEPAIQQAQKDFLCCQTTNHCSYG
jgi:hypothetical protein